jgi:hypothetical protein
MGVDGEAIMNDMINTGRGDNEGDYTLAEPDTQPRQHGYEPTTLAMSHCCQPMACPRRTG